MTDTILDQTIATPRGTFGIRRDPTTSGQPVLCLHGFPDDASTFDDLAERLKGSGYAATSLYLRGYAPSPLDGPLDLPSLVDDIFAVMDALGFVEPIHLVGHDYGAQLAYATMSTDASRFRSTVALAGAHPAAIASNTRRHPRQLWMSRYIVLFQLGRIADRRVAAHDFAYVDRLWRRWAPGLEATAHLRRVKVTLTRSMPAPVAMYRAGGFQIGDGPITTPTLFICGTDDGCSLPAMANGQERLFAAPYECQTWTKTGHFPHLEHPQRVADEVTRWFEKTSRPS